MKAISPALASHLENGVTTLCHCFKIIRRDGVTMGFSDHDKSLSFDGTIFLPATGFSASQVETSLGLSVDGLDVLGALSADAITSADILAGRYDDARIELWRVNWRDTAQRVLMRAGDIGETSRGPGVFTAEVRGLAHRLNQPVGRLFQSPCDADLGDARCGINLDQPAFKGTGQVATVDPVLSDRAFTVTGLNGFAPGWLARGLLTGTSGGNHGQKVEVRDHRQEPNGITLVTWLPMTSTIHSGDGFSITAGCDKRWETCRDRFSNLINFRGMPFMPGTDWVQSYPNRGEQLDGSSLRTGRSS